MSASSSEGLSEINELLFCQKGQRKEAENSQICLPFNNLNVH